jgi:hypothetical protein
MDAIARHEASGKIKQLCLSAALVKVLVSLHYLLLN